MATTHASLDVPAPTGRRPLASHLRSALAGIGRHQRADAAERPAGVTEAEARIVLAGLADTLRPVEDVCRGHGERYAALRAAALATGAPFATTQLGRLTPVLHRSLDALHGIAYGLGVIVAPDTLADAPLWLEWWYAGSDGEPRFLEVSLDPDDPGFYEYVRAEWFSVPARTHAPWIAGPYLDRGGMDVDLCTLALPVLDGDAFLGVVGADIRVDRLEATLTPLLGRLAADAALVNGDGRIVVSNTARLLTGDLLEPRDNAWATAATESWLRRPDGATLTRAEGVQWALVTFPRDSA